MTVLNCCTQISVGRPVHQISLVAHYRLTSDTERRALTVESNVIELTTDQFRPFAFYSFLSQLQARSVARSSLLTCRATEFLLVAIVLSFQLQDIIFECRTHSLRHLHSVSYIRCHLDYFSSLSGISTYMQHCFCLLFPYLPFTSFPFFPFFSFH